MFQFLHSKEFYFGLLGGAGLVALFQNLFNYRIDTEFLEYVYDPLKTYFLRFFGKQTLAKIETEALSIAHDAFAKLTVLANSAESDGAKVIVEVKKVAAEIQAKL